MRKKLPVANYRQTLPVAFGKGPCCGRNEEPARGLARPLLPRKGRQGSKMALEDLELPCCHADSDRGLTRTQEQRRVVVNQVVDDIVGSRGIRRRQSDCAPTVRGIADRAIAGSERVCRKRAREIVDVERPTAGG